MLKVAFLTDAPRVAGSEVWLLGVLPHLPERGVWPSVFLPQGAPLDAFAERLGEVGLEVTRFGRLGDLPALTRDFDVRVMHAWGLLTYQRLLPHLAQPRWVVLHDQLEFFYPLGLRAFYRLGFRLTKGWGLRHAGGVLTVSAWADAWLRRFRLPPSADVRTGFVRNSVDTRRFRPAEPDERAALRAAFGFTRFTVLVPGRFVLEKNQLAALLAARHARDLDFAFVGDMDSALGKLARRLAQVYRLGNVRFLGRRWDMPELYRAADALLQPTLAENQSLVTLEAMASGLPIVTTPIPAQAELVRHEVEGLLVPARPARLALALRRLASHPPDARQLGAAARERVLAFHTPGQAASALAELLLTAPHPSTPTLNLPALS
ncbi:lipopolysaccharide biosynthesis protein [Deinococcus irradiatisoli]|uniref:Lipopolysaccharide biosynthesis protein n=1 Tax=Deinococcus irradiatisoli TaxID=2202254 RepID=A0A2Z3JB99_9DEIO|nr:glycosyltransferase family 4 protein [Deinococcus irradiatisoli]AWN22427.1 lipopolysaccharide biosynthesis protein [Deinococcus irradiatisoli]